MNQNKDEAVAYTRNAEESTLSLNSEGDLSNPELSSKAEAPKKDEKKKNKEKKQPLHQTYTPISTDEVIFLNPIDLTRNCTTQEQIVRDIKALKVSMIEKGKEKHPVKIGKHYFRDIQEVEDCLTRFKSEVDGPFKAFNRRLSALDVARPVIHTKQLSEAHDHGFTIDGMDDIGVVSAQTVTGAGMAISMPILFLGIAGIQVGMIFSMREMHALSNAVQVLQKRLKAKTASTVEVLNTLISLSISQDYIIQAVQVQQDDSLSHGEKVEKIAKLKKGYHRATSEHAKIVAQDTRSLRTGKNEAKRPMHPSSELSNKVKKIKADTTLGNEQKREQITAAVKCRISKIIAEGNPSKEGHFQSELAKINENTKESTAQKLQKIKSLIISQKGSQKSLRELQATLVDNENSPASLVQSVAAITSARQAIEAGTKLTVNKIGLFGAKGSVGANGVMMAGVMTSMVNAMVPTASAAASVASVAMLGAAEVLLIASSVLRLGTLAHAEHGRRKDLKTLTNQWNLAYGDDPRYAPYKLMVESLLRDHRFVDAVLGASNLAFIAGGSSILAGVVTLNLPLSLAGAGSIIAGSIMSVVADKMGHKHHGYIKPGIYLDMAKLSAMSAVSATSYEGALMTISRELCKYTEVSGKYTARIEIIRAIKSTHQRHFLDLRSNRLKAFEEEIRKLSEVKADYLAPRTKAIAEIHKSQEHLKYRETLDLLYLDLRPVLAVELYKNLREVERGVRPDLPVNPLEKLTPAEVKKMSYRQKAELMLNLAMKMKCLEDAMAKTTKRIIGMPKLDQGAIIGSEYVAKEALIGKGLASEQVYYIRQDQLLKALDQVDIDPDRSSSLLRSVEIECFNAIMTRASEQAYSVGHDAMTSIPSILQSLGALKENSKKVAQDKSKELTGKFLELRNTTANLSEVEASGARGSTGSTAASLADILDREGIYANHQESKEAARLLLNNPAPQKLPRENRPQELNQLRTAPEVVVRG